MALLFEKNQRKWLYSWRSDKFPEDPLHVIFPSNLAIAISSS